MMSRLRKLSVFAVTICLLFGCIGCFGLEKFTSKQEATIDPTAYLHEFENNPHYRLMSNEMQKCYGTIYTALTDNFDKEEEVTISDGSGKTQACKGIRVTLPYALDDNEQSQILYNAVFYDNPHFFYMNNLYGLEGYEKDGEPYYNTILLTYSMNADERLTAFDTLDKVVNTIVKGAPKTTDEYETELYLHKELTKRCVYDDAAAKGEYTDNPSAYSAYGALVNGKAVCEGYSRAMQLLLKKCGIASTPVLGSSIETGEQHMWNMVTINGKDYHLDVTWNDSGEEPRHNYFNVTTAQIALSHRIDDNQPTLKNCTATDDNYYVRNGLYIDTYRRQDVAAIIAKHIKAGDTQIELFFAADKYESALLFLKNRNAAEEMINPHLAGSDYSLWNYNLYAESEEHILWIRKK